MLSSRLWRGRVQAGLVCLSTWYVLVSFHCIHSKHVLGVLSPSLFSVPVLIALLVVTHVDTGMLLAYCFADESLVCG